VSGNDIEAEVKQRLARVRERLASACARAGREPSEVTLVGVSKRQHPARIAAAVRAGVRHLGENYVQELRDKRPLVEQLLAGHHPPPRWRMIGSLQRNKVRHAIELFDAVETIDREKLARELDRRLATARVSEPMEVCLQVNLSGEEQKGGVSEQELPALLEACAPLSQLRVVGLMTIPAPSQDPEATRPVFAHLRQLRDTLRQEPGGENLRELSMGMSSDFEQAIEEGATLVRVGTAVFGPRPPPASA
jgi:pyridoxal phosphate enzyme (YggS family)